MRVSSRRLRSCVPHSLHKQRFPPSVSPARTSAPSAIASNLVSFGGSDEEPLDDSMSLVASEAEDWSGSPHDPAPLPSLEPIDARASVDSELIRVYSKAVEQLGLEWSAPEELTRSRLDEWFLPGRHQAPPQRGRAPHSARLRSSASHIFTSVDDAEKKGYVKLPPLDEAAHLCPPAAIGWKRNSSTHPSPAVQCRPSLDGCTPWPARQRLPCTQWRYSRCTRLSSCGPCTRRDTTRPILRSCAAPRTWPCTPRTKNVFLDSPVSPTGLFDPAVDGFAEHFTATRKSSQAMQHFLPKRSRSSASSRPKPVSAQQPPKATPTPRPDHRQRSRSARRHPPVTVILPNNTCFWINIFC
ncbi:uncharacterized protein LOC127513446 [Ctenopharyngodon idella]|uniref:uncharacterized protein LOC127513446 n=1 Tax=Ctenopharyngodon idella TaxID=7959 RepID=UPI00222F2536|nr:uncharacterized protein LOC127513446 [Ctenopharyngodon idella]